MSYSYKTMETDPNVDAAYAVYAGDAQQGSVYRVGSKWYAAHEGAGAPHMGPEKTRTAAAALLAAPSDPGPVEPAAIPDPAPIPAVPAAAPVAAITDDPIPPTLEPFPHRVDDPAGEVSYRGHLGVQDKPRKPGVFARIKAWFGA